MGIYDWNNKYDPNTKYTISGLAMELLFEVENCENPTDEEITGMRKRLFNTANTGLGDRLKKYLFYDIKQNANHNARDKFEMLQLLKAIFLIEKLGVFPSGEKYQDGKNFPLIKLLSKPRLGHINSVYFNNSEYGKYLDMLINDLSKKVDFPEKTRDKLEYIDSYWCNFGSAIFKYCNLCSDFCYLKSSTEELKMINYYLKEVLKLLNNVRETKIDKHGKTNGYFKYKANVFESFYNILHYYIYRCYDIQEANDNGEIFLEKISDAAYCENFNKHKEYLVNTSIVQELRDYLEGKSLDLKNEDCMLLLELVKNGVKHCAEKDIVFALNRVNPLLCLFEIEMKTNFSECIDIILIAAILQEIICVHKSSINVKDDVLGFTNSKKALTSIYTGENNCSSNYKFCDLTSVPPIIKKNWLNRVIIRILMNVGLIDNLKLYINSKQIVSEIKSEIFYYVNVDDVYGITDIILDNISIIRRKNFEKDAVDEALCKVARYLNAI